MENTKTQVLRLKNRRPELGSKIYELVISTLLVLLLPEQGSHYALGKSTDLGIGSPKKCGEITVPNKLRVPRCMSFHALLGPGNK